MRFFGRERKSDVDEPYWGSDRQVFRRPEATELSFSRLHFLRSAADHEALQRVAGRIQKERSNLTEEQIVSEFQDLQKRVDQDKPAGG